MIQQMPAIWSLVPLPFLNPALTLDMNNMFIIIIVHNKTDKISEKNFILKENDAMNRKQIPKQYITLLG